MSTEVIDFEWECGRMQSERGQLPRRPMQHISDGRSDLRDMWRSMLGAAKRQTSPP